MNSSKDRQVEKSFKILFTTLLSGDKREAANRKVCMMDERLNTLLRVKLLNDKLVVFLQGAM